jgi:repressor LexA
VTDPEQDGDPLKGRNEFQELRGPLHMLIARRMAELRIRNLQQFADRFGIGRSTLYDLVRGRSPSHKTWGKPSLDTLVLLASALDKPLHELVYLIEPEAPGADVTWVPATMS